MNQLEICQKLAISRNGLCLSNEYKNNKTKMLWYCNKCNYKWQSIWKHINKTSWCPKCAKVLKPTINDIQKHANKKNGLLISTNYINASTSLLWQCEFNHQWEATWNNIKGKDSWCPTCTGQNKPNINELQKFAELKNGKLLSIEYISARLNLLWECSEGHQWKANWDNIKNKNNWCPYCSSFKTENLCRKLLEEKFNFKFSKHRFYYNDQRLEFDGYNEENNIAFEYHGEQHYKFPNHFHKTKKEFLDAQKRDDLKEQFCAENNIKLIIIPYTKQNNLERYINETIMQY